MGGKGRDTEERFNIISKWKGKLLLTVLVLNPKIRWAAQPKAGILKYYSSDYWM